MKKIIITSIFGMAALAATAQTYELTAPRKWEPIRSEHLQMGGKAPDGGSIDVMSSTIRAIRPNSGSRKLSR